MAKHFAFIFARGGSKGLPNKNIRLLNDKPLLAYSIETAQATPEIDRVFVSTDCEDIALVATQYGAELIERPSELAQDKSPEWLAWRHAIEVVEGKYGRFDSFVSLPATSPLRSVDDVSAAVSRLYNSDGDICISITPANRNPYFNMVKQDAQGYCQLVNSLDADVKRRQDAPSVFDITTVVYASTPGFILEKEGLFQGNVVAVEVPKERAVDIDDIYDFVFAEALINMK